MWIFAKVFVFTIFLFAHFSLANTDFKNEVEEFNQILKDETTLVVLFTVPCCTCTECVEAEVLVGGMSKELEDNLGAMVVRLKNAEIKQRYGIKKVPRMVYIRNNVTATYDGAFDFDSVYHWLQDNLQPATVNLNDKTFEHLTQAASGATTGDWLVIFHDNQCVKNKELLHLENVGIKLKNKLNVASVNILTSPETKERFQITSCPEIYFFRHQKMYKFLLSEVNANTLRRFVEGFYKNAKAKQVPPPLTMFDKVRDGTLEFCIKNWDFIIVGIAIAGGLMLIWFLLSLRKPSHLKSN